MVPVNLSRGRQPVAVERVQKTGPWLCCIESLGQAVLAGKSLVVQVKILKVENP
jgi:hypothetical protein